MCLQAVANFMTRTSSSFPAKSNCHIKLIQRLFHWPFWSVLDTYQCTFSIKWKYYSVCMCIRRINWNCKLIKKIQWQYLVWGPWYSTPHFPDHPLPLSQRLDECPTPPHPTSPQALDPPRRSADQSTSCPWFLFFLCPGARAFLAFFLFLPFLFLLPVDWLFSSFSFSLFLNSLHYFNTVPYPCLLRKQKLHHLIRYPYFSSRKQKCYTLYS